MTVTPAPGNDNLYIDGQWTAATAHIEVTDLAAGGTFARVADATPADGEDALAAAASARRAMRETTVVQRAAWTAPIGEANVHQKGRLAKVLG